jgi:hypothetical protein
MSRARLAILTRTRDDFRERHYLVKLMFPIWEELGIEVVVVTDDEPFVPADLALLHVDLSVVPDRCRRLAERYPRVLNGSVLDIRKRTFSRDLVSRDGPDPGPVIVKTDLNCGGRQEFREAILDSRAVRALRPLGLGEQAHRFRDWLEEQRPWSRRTWIHTSEYRVFASRSAVPRAVWGNRNLIVERFLSERRGDLYACRHWVFFGDRDRHSRTLSTAPAVKGRTSIEALSDPVPDALREMRRRLGFDYGKFDYGVVDGRIVVYDVNRTPGIASDPSAHAAAVAELAPGIQAFLKGS